MSVRTIVRALAVLSALFFTTRLWMSERPRPGLTVEGPTFTRHSVPIIERDIQLEDLGRFTFGQPSVRVIRTRFSGEYEVRILAPNDDTDPAGWKAGDGIQCVVQRGSGPRLSRVIRYGKDEAGFGLNRDSVQFTVWREALKAGEEVRIELSALTSEPSNTPLKARGLFENWGTYQEAVMDFLTSLVLAVISITTVVIVSSPRNQKGGAVKRHATRADCVLDPGALG